MQKTVFFKKKQNILISKLFPNLNFDKKDKVLNITTLNKSKKHDLTFFDSIKYKSFAEHTKASYCLTTKKLENYLPQNVKKIVVKNVLFELAKVPVNAISVLLAKETVPSGATFVFALSAIQIETLRELPKVPGCFAAKLVPEVVVDS